MCGLVGFDVSKAGLAKEQRAIMSAILSVANDGRGGDSWGYYNFHEIKRGLGDLADHAIEMFRHSFVMAHTRKATQGTVSKENAHPFDIGNIIGAHNGVISNHHPLNSKYDRNCTVDSQHIFHHLNEGKPLDDIRGYGVIEWVQKTDTTRRVYLCKLQAGDLAIFGIGKSKDNVRGIIWSSDNDHIKAAVQAAHIEGFFYEVKPNSVYYVENGKLFIDDDRKLEINRDMSRTWEGGTTHYPSHWGGYTGEYFSDNSEASSKITQDDELDAIIERFRKEEGMRTEDDTPDKSDQTKDEKESTKDSKEAPAALNFDTTTGTWSVKDEKGNDVPVENLQE